VKRFWRKKKKSPPVELSPVMTLELIKSRQFRSQVKKHFNAIFVLSVGVFITVGAVASIYIASHVMNVSHAIKLRGVVQAIEVSTPISHTIGGVVKNIMITEGEVVQEGQVLMSLDAADLKVEQIEARQEVTQLMLRNLCLRAITNDKQEIAVPQLLKNTVGQLGQVKEMQRGLRDCKTRIEQRALHNSKVENSLASLRDQVSLFTRLVATDRDLRLSRNSDTGDASLSKLAREAHLNSLVKALDYSIKLSQAEQQLFSEQKDIDNAALLEEQEIRQELERNSDALMFAEAELSRLDNLVENRFLYASTSGRVQRLRISEAGKRLSAGAYVMEIAPLTSDFEVISNVPLKEISHLSLNQVVSVQFSGSSPIPVTVPGRIAKISKVTANSRSVTILIDRADINRRDLLLGDRLLNGQSEQAEAVISVQAETAGNALFGILRKAPEPLETSTGT
jgi:multidrug efflux pump subunit AcrA (membrane-fusion protein)